MRIYEYSKGKGLPTSPCAVALGFFDGVHIAHRELISLCVNEARSRGLISVVFTFRSEDTRLKGRAARIYPTSEKLALIAELGVDAAVVADFSSIADLSPSAFVDEVLIGELGMRLALSGYNFRFGHNASADSAELSRLCRESGVDCLLLEELSDEGGAICSTRIRDALSVGDIEQANRLLGSPYRIIGSVVRGRGVGRTLGFPTVNTDLDESCLCPKRGVYRTAIAIEGKLYPALTNVGVCPTFRLSRAHAETYIIGFDGDLYGDEIKIYFLGFLREEKRFNTPDELIMQINIDKNEAVRKNKEDLEKTKWTEIGLS